MVKKKVLIAIAVATALTIPLSVFAATSNSKTAKSIRGFFGIDFSKLTDTQKADVKSYSQKMADLQKEFINKMVENGSLTKEQGNAEISRIDEMMKNGGENGSVPGFSMGRGGHEKQGEFGFGKIYTSKLTDQQKADLKEVYKKITELQKEYINKLVSYSLFTKEQGDAAIKKIDELSKSMENGNFAKSIIGRGGFGLFGLHGIDTSKLTNAQKTDLDTFPARMTALHKELINKMVENGAITKEQGDAAIQGISDMAKNKGNKMFPNGNGMRKGRFGGQGRQNGNTDTEASPSTT